MSDTDTTVESPHFEDISEDEFPDSGWGQGRSKAANTLLAEEDLMTSAKRQEEGAKGIVLHGVAKRYGFPETPEGMEKAKDKLRTAADNLDVSVDIRTITKAPADLAIRVVPRRRRERKPKEATTEAPKAPADKTAKTAKAAAKK